MSRVTRLRVLSVAVCLALSLIARSAAATEPTSEQKNQRLKEELARVERRLQESEKLVETYRTQIRTPSLKLVVPAQILPPQRLPYLRVIPPTQQTPQGWILRNQNVNTWHYIVPVGP